MPRQKLNYHLRVLEGQQLLELVELRARRGFTERVMRTVGDGLLVDPDVLLGAPRPAAVVDRHAADHLVQTASDVVRNVSRMSSSAQRDGKRLLTFTLESEVRFAAPTDVHDFTDALAAAVLEVVQAFDRPGGRTYRLIAAGHPAPAPGDAAKEATRVRRKH
jgi:hypothetical protein